MKIKQMMITLLLLILVTGFSVTVSARNKRRLANGYMLEPAGSSLAVELAKFFRGYTSLKKTGAGCDIEVVRYGVVGSEDKFYQWVVKTADRNGNTNGIAEVAELQAMLDTACANRGK